MYGSLEVCTEFHYCADAAQRSRLPSYFELSVLLIVFTSVDIDMIICLSSVYIHQLGSS